MGEGHFRQSCLVRHRQEGSAPRGPGLGLRGTESTSCEHHSGERGSLDSVLVWEQTPASVP